MDLTTVGYVACFAVLLLLAIRVPKRNCCMSR